MNAQLGAAKRADPLESHIAELRDHVPSGAVIIGGAGDSRPADALRRLGNRLGGEVIILHGTWHHPWLEAPDRLGPAFRAAVQKQARRAD